MPTSLASSTRQFNRNEPNQPRARALTVRSNSAVSDPIAVRQRQEASIGHDRPVITDRHQPAFSGIFSRQPTIDEPSYLR